MSVPYIYSLADLTSALSSDVSSVASVATASASAGLGSWLKKVAFRAAGKEGLAENVRNEQGRPFGVDAIHAAQDLKAREEIRYREELRTIHCTDTSGQVFAVLVSCFYLLPLTWLFVRSFIRSYTGRREHQGRDKSSKLHTIEESGKDAAKNVKRQLDRSLDEQPGSMLDQDSTTTAPSGKEKQSVASKQGGNDAGAKTGEPKKQNDNGENQNRSGKESSGSGSAQNRGPKTEEDKEDTEKEDVEILDSAEAVKDVLAEGLETADKFSKDLENSKAG